MLVGLEPLPLHHLPRVRLILLHPHVVGEPHVFVHVEVEEGAGDAPGPGLDQVVEGVVSRDDQILLHEQEPFRRRPPQLRKLLRESRLRLLQEGPHRGSLGHRQAAPVPGAVPVAEDDLQRLFLDARLLLRPLGRQPGALRQNPLLPEPVMCVER